MTTEGHLWQPILIRPLEEAGWRLLARLRADPQTIPSADTIDQQLGDLRASRNPERVVDHAGPSPAFNETEGVPRDRFGTWVYYPWSRRLVHLLPEPLFRELRADRNRDKITREEQHRLGTAIIGVVGLSVGLASAVTLALEGVGRHFRLADFDVLSLSNLNRLRAGCADLGLNKAVLAARQLFEIDPYLTIEIIEDGITDTNMAAFLGAGAGRLSVLIEECDDFRMKIRLREAARAAEIPVVMETNDRGLVDIERYDREPGRPLFHGRIEGIDGAGFGHLSPLEKLPILLRFLDRDRISPRLAGSFAALGKTLSSWPQLASGVALGGAIVTDVTRRLLLGELNRSGRYYVDLETLIVDAEAP